MPQIMVDKWKYVDPNDELYLGHQYEKNGQRAWYKRCDYCRKYFTFDVKQFQTWGNNIKMGMNGIPEKIHCGNSTCQDYHDRVLKHEARTAETFRKTGERLFFDLKRKGVVA